MTLLQEPKLREPKLREREFKSFKSLIYDHAGIALADTKLIMVQGRLAKRLRALEIDSYEDYLSLLRSNGTSAELTNFINALTTNKTDFFREKHHFDYLLGTVFPELQRRADASNAKRLRIWCSASSTGEEPYTLAMCVREYFGFDSAWDIKILASDIDTNVLNSAADGVYVADRVVDIPPALLKKYFSKESRDPDSPYSAKSTLRELITFRRINLQDSEWPIRTEFDAIFCRNVMIYFDAPSQTKLVNHFADHLHPEGYLFIGHSESLFGLTDKYMPCGDTTYRLKESATRNNSPAGRGPTSTVSRALPAPQMQSQQSFKTQSSQPTAAPGTDPKHNIIVGEVYASERAEWISTLLGSCVATCLYDDVKKIGGMNHFMLPDSSMGSKLTASIGVHAMELLINQIMKLGGSRKNLKAKIFGGGKVLERQSDRWNIGQKNIDFAKAFLQTEQIPIVACHTGGNVGMSIKFNTHSTKVLVRLLDHPTSIRIEKSQYKVAEEVVRSQYEHKDITLF